MAPKATAVAKPAPKPVHERGKEWEAEKLTGKRAQRGATYTYEVKWKGKWANTFEPPSMLIGSGWEAEMKKIDEAIKQEARR